MTVIKTIEVGKVTGWLKPPEEDIPTHPLYEVSLADLINQGRRDEDEVSKEELEFQKSEVDRLTLANRMIVEKTQENLDNMRQEVIVKNRDIEILKEALRKAAEYINTEREVVKILSRVYEKT